VALERDKNEVSKYGFMLFVAASSPKLQLFKVEKNGKILKLLDIFLFFNIYTVILSPAQ
jgi:hypothetical protein